MQPMWRNPSPIKWANPSDFGLLFHIDSAQAHIRKRIRKHFPIYNVSRRETLDFKQLNKRNVAMGRSKLPSPNQFTR